MNVILFGASGMVGQGVLRECLLADDVARVLVIGRNVLGQSHPKIQEIVLPDLADYSTVVERLRGYDACFFCLGVSAAGMSEADYRRVTFDFTLAAARTLVEAAPAMTFIYVSGAGTDSTETGRIMWARVKGATENALLRLPFRAAYMFRPGFIRPLHGARSRTRAYRLIYQLSAPLLPLLAALLPKQITDTEVIGRAMLALARHAGDSGEMGAKAVLEAPAINAVGRRRAAAARRADSRPG